MLYIKTNIHRLQISTGKLRMLGLYSLLLLGSIFSANHANALGIEENESVLELIEQVETYQQQEKYQLKKQRKVTPNKAFNMADTRNNENLYSPKFTLNHRFNIVDVDSNRVLNLNDVSSLTEVQGVITDGNDASLFSDTGSNSSSIEVERIN